MSNSNSNSMKLIEQSQHKFRFISVVTLLILIGFIATSLISYYVAHKTISNQITESSLPLTSDNVYSEIQRDLMRPIFIASLMAQDTFVRDWALQGEKNTEQLTRYLSGIQNKYQTVTAFFVSDESRKYYHSTGVLKQVETTEPLDAWYFRVAKMKSEYEINVDHNTANPSALAVFVNFKVFDYSDKFIGATGVGLALDKVQKLIESYQRKYHREVYFTSTEGELTLRGQHYEGALNLAINPHFKHIFEANNVKNQDMFSYVEGAHRVYVNTRYIPEFDWYLIIEQRDDAESSQLLTSLIINIIVSIVISIIVLTASYYTIAGYQKKLEHMAATDKLSGALNRHSFDILLTQHMLIAERKNQTFSGILLDIDFFKRINDTYGHLAGDRVIQESVKVIRANLRESDVLCRWGGEEFLILLSDCDIAFAEKIAEKIRVAFTEHTFIDGEHLTASFGVGQFKTKETQTEWVHKIDKALYIAKSTGRNKVISA